MDGSINHFSWAGSDLVSGYPVIRRSVSEILALPGGKSNPSISRGKFWLQHEKTSFFRT